MESLAFTGHNATHGALFLVAWLLSVVIYRLFLHPLAKVPGPSSAALTRLYLFYFNTVKGGTLYLQIEKLHEIYGMSGFLFSFSSVSPESMMTEANGNVGPIVRIAPNEIHLKDPENYDKIYTIGSKFDKDPVFYSALGADNTFAISSNVIHRKRRAPLNPFFSRRAILDLEDMVHRKVESLCRVLENCMEHGVPFNLHDGYRALAIDIATEYAFDDCWNHLEAPDFGRWFSNMVKNSGRTFWIFQQFPLLRHVMVALPQWLARRASPTIADMLDTKLVIRELPQPALEICNAKPVSCKENGKSCPRGARQHQERHQIRSPYYLP